MLRIHGRDHDLGGGMLVHRILPFMKKRMVGPFVFLDHMGPLETKPDQNTDVRPHPHIGLSTLTYLFEGRIVHRDSLGCEALIEPGEVNWMTAGKGISHSERAHDKDKGKPRRLHGLQFWVALPDDQEDCDPSFQHYEKTDIPRRETDDYKMSVVVGEGFEMKSPVKATSPMIFAEFVAKQDFVFQPEFPNFELALYIIKGTAECEEEKASDIDMMIFDVGVNPRVTVKAGTHFVLIGGVPFATPRHIWWNLVSSSREKIEEAKRAWKDRSFPQVPGETEFIPLPEN